MQSDGSVSVFGLKLGYYLTRRVAKGSKVKQRIFGKLIRAEAIGSKSKAKKYLEDKMPELSTSLVLKVFHKSTYLHSSRSTGAVLNNLMQDHVQECADFAVCQNRYLAWLKDLE